MSAPNVSDPIAELRDCFDVLGPPGAKTWTFACKRCNKAFSVPKLGGGALINALHRSALLVHAAGHV